MFDSIKDWLASKGLSLLGTVVEVAVIAAVGILVIRAVMKIIDKTLERSKLEKAAYSLIKTLAQTVMYVLLALIIASALGINVTGIVALASVVSLAISLALQNMLTNIVGGFTILYTHPFGSGDYVEIAGQSGTVKEVGIAYTKLTTPDNKVVSIPNSAVTSAEIVNYSVSGTRRVDIAVSASYDAPAQKVIETLVDAAGEPAVLTEPAAPAAFLTGYGDSAINYSLRFWVKTEDYWDVYFTVNQKIKTAFDESGIEMTYPHLNVHLDK